MQGDLKKNISVVFLFSSFSLNQLHKIKYYVAPFTDFKSWTIDKTNAL
jgi:hypothetical protein